MSHGYARPATLSAQELGFNVALPSSAEWSRILHDTGKNQSFYIASGANGVIDPQTGLPVSGDCKLTIQLRDAVKYPIGNYTVSWTGGATFDGQSSPISLSVTGGTGAVTWLTSGTVTSFSITPDFQLPRMDLFTETFDSRARTGECLRFMEAWRINEDGGASAAEYNVLHPYVRIRTVPGANTFYHTLLTPTTVGEIGYRYGRDIWINSHHRASDANITDTITEITDTGFSGTIYWEYSNEVWNSQFPQWQWMLDLANASGNYVGLGDTAKVAAQHADRTDLLGTIAKAAYPKTVVVLGGWTAVPNTGRQAWNFGVRSPFSNIDAVAVSWYFGGPPSRALSESEALALDAQGLADLGRDDWQDRVIPLLLEWKGDNDGRAVRTLGYEGGSHFDRNPKDAASPHLSALSQSAEVGVVHAEAMDWWDLNIADLACFFQSVGNPDDPWSWLHGELGATSPRLQAYYDRVRKS